MKTSCVDYVIGGMIIDLFCKFHGSCKDKVRDALRRRAILY